MSPLSDLIPNCVQIPNVVFSDWLPMMNGAEAKAVMAFLYREYADGRGICLEYVAEEAGLSEAIAEDVLAVLEGAGVLKPEGDWHRVNLAWDWRDGREKLRAARDARKTEVKLMAGNTALRPVQGAIIGTHLMVGNTVVRNAGPQFESIAEANAFRQIMTLRGMTQEQAAGLLKQYGVQPCVGWIPWCKEKESPIGFYLTKLRSRETPPPYDHNPDVERNRAYLASLREGKHISELPEETEFESQLALEKESPSMARELPEKRKSRLGWADEKEEFYQKWKAAFLAKEATKRADPRMVEDKE